MNYKKDETRCMQAGASVRDISPEDSQFLYGYPHVERYSTGIHDPLLSSALFLSDGEHEVLLVANDIIYVPRDMIKRARKRITEVTSVPDTNIMITATHTHSGPITTDKLTNEADTAVPPPDPAYLQLLEDGIVESAVEAWRDRQNAETALACADASGVGTNRRDPSGPADPEVPVLLVRNADSHDSIAAMIVYSMHPTVLHEDSKLVSSDFPGYTRQYLQENVLGGACPVLYHMGPSGNQSTRHVIRENTFKEAERLGKMLGKAIESTIGKLADADFSTEQAIICDRNLVDLPGKAFPPVDEAEEKLRRAIERLETLREENAPRQTVRTAECDWFGAEESVTLAKAAANGRLQSLQSSYLPAEIQLVKIGDWSFVGWPGEIFVEYSLKVKEQKANTFVISLANGELQGYIVTPEAAAEGGYEASNALFAPESGKILAEETIKLLNKHGVPEN